MVISKYSLGVSGAEKWFKLKNLTFGRWGGWGLFLRGVSCVSVGIAKVDLRVGWRAM